jgi:putative colanic acid biosynthesis acetyltransferase WcaF
MADGPLDASLNQPLMGGPSFGLGHRLRRALWTLVWTVLAAWTPPPLHRWRVLLVRVFGGHVHWSAHVYGGARIWYPPNLTMKANSTLAQGVICYCIGPIEASAP